MKLSYRGVKYECQPSMLEVTEGEMGGTYRGQPWQLRYLRHIPEPAPVHNLKYRGVAYRTGQPTVIEPSAIAQPVSTPWARTLYNHHKREVLDETRRIHLANIRSNLERRMQAAKARGDEQLVRLLEQEQRAFPQQ